LPININWQRLEKGYAQGMPNSKMLVLQCKITLDADKMGEKIAAGLIKQCAE
jgi:hypothetical protein